MSFDDFQYNNINTYILNQIVNIKPKKQELSDNSSQQGTPEKEEEDDEEFEQQKLFSENEICSIEDKQEFNVFEDVKEYMEDNYIELETMINKLKVEDEND